MSSPCSGKKTRTLAAQAVDQVAEAAELRVLVFRSVDDAVVEEMLKPAGDLLEGPLLLTAELLAPTSAVESPVR